MPSLPVRPKSTVLPRESFSFFPKISNTTPTFPFFISLEKTVTDKQFTFQHSLTVTSQADTFTVYTYLIFPVRILPAYCIPVRAMYILKISLVPYNQTEKKKKKPTWKWGGNMFILSFMCPLVVKIWRKRLQFPLHHFQVIFEKLHETEIIIYFSSLNVTHPRVIRDIWAGNNVRYMDKDLETAKVCDIFI